MRGSCEIFDILDSNDNDYKPIINSKICYLEEANLIKDEYDFEKYVEYYHLNECTGINFNPSYNHKGTRIFPDDVINHRGTIVIDEKYKGKLVKGDLTKLRRDKKASNAKHAFIYANKDIIISPTRLKQLINFKITFIKTCVFKNLV